MKNMIPVVVAGALLTCTGAALAQDGMRWIHPSEAFSLDLAATGLEPTATGPVTIFARPGDVPGIGCTLVARSLPTTRSQQQINASTESYRLNEPGIRDFETETVDGVAIVSFVRQRGGEQRVRRVRLFGVAVGATAVFGELGCDGLAPLSAEQESAYTSFLGSLRFSSTNSN